MSLGAKKALLAVVCLAGLSIYVVRVVEVYRAQALAQHPSEQPTSSSNLAPAVADLEHAIRLVPDDAEFPYLLGLRLSATDQDDGAISNLRQAVAVDPNNGRYWLDLASVYQVTADTQKEQEALRSALDSEPGNPIIAAEAAQFFLVAGDQDRAFPLFKQALAQNPEAAQTILPVCWREASDANLLMAQAIPANPELQLAFLRMLITQKETSAAQQAWRYIVAARKSFPPQLSFFYFDYLLKEHDVADFDRDWHELAGLVPEIQAYLPGDNLIVNAGFEQPLLNSGFDWRHEPADHVAAGLDDKVVHSGAHSLSLSYDGGPAYEAGWAQFVPVQPNLDYDFSAWVRSDNITSSSGPRIAIVDAFGDSSLLLTNDLLDTHPWQELKGTLHVPAGTQLLAVKIIRAPANTRIRGRIWIDDLRLMKRVN